MTKISVDVHAHLVPVVEDRLADLEGVEWTDGRLWVDGHQIGILAIYRPDRLIEWMDANSIERALVSAPPPLYRSHLPPEAARAWVEYVNVGLHEICAARSDRLDHALHIPIGHAALAAEIAEAGLRRGATLYSIGASGINGIAFSDPALRPMWQALNEASAFLFVHPGSCCDGRLRDYYLENLLGNPYETSVAVAHMIFSGVPSRYPNIRTCLAHAGGATPMLVGRWQRGFSTDRPGIDKTLESPRKAVRRFYADCIAHDAEALKLAAAFFGEDHILFGSDWPFPMGLIDTKNQSADIDNNLRDLVLKTNATKLFGRG